MNSVIEATPAAAINGLLTLIKAQRPILDVTYGNGLFWSDGFQPDIAMDRNPDRAQHLCASFFALPFKEVSIPTVIYDPPFHPDVNSREQQRFSVMGRNEGELKTRFQLGLEECWSVTKHHLIVKCQGYVHNHRVQWMPLWCVETLGQPFEWLVVLRKQKVISGRWVSNNSLRRNHADYLVYSKLGNKR